MQSDGPRCIDPLNIELHERPQLEVLILAWTAVPSRASLPPRCPLLSAKPTSLLGIRTSEFDPKRKWRVVDLLSKLLPKLADVSPKSIFCRTRLSPPTFRQRNSAGSHQDNDDDSGKRLYRGQGVVPVVPKLKHALASIERAPTSDKTHSVERTCLQAQEHNATFCRVRFDRGATWPVPDARISSERRLRSPRSAIARGYVEDVG